MYLYSESCYNLVPLDYTPEPIQYSFLPAPHPLHTNEPFSDENNSSEMKRILKSPSTQAEFDQNKKIMKGFFDTYLVALSPEDVANFGAKLIGCDYGKLIFDSQITMGKICHYKVVSDLFDNWIRRKGWKADLHEIQCILMEMGNTLMCDNMTFYIREKSNQFSRNLSMTLY